MADVRVVGVDGVRERWLAAVLELDPEGVEPARCQWLVGRAGHVLALAQEPDVRMIGIDVPIGLTARGARLADAEARQLLGRAAGSIFATAPAAAFAIARRKGASQATRAEADAASRAVDGGGVSMQSWLIAPKVLEVEDAVRALGPAGERVVEVHPESAFTVMARHFGHKPPASKQTAAGVAQRIALLGLTLPGLDVLAAVSSAPTESGAKNRIPIDDALDAIAAAAAALRHCYGAATVLGRVSDAVWSDGAPAPGRAVIVI